MGAGTTGGSDTGRNDCGIATGHAYSILETFRLNNGGSEIQMLLMRNPWGVTYYNGPWYKNDALWTTANIAQVPFGINPTTSGDADGIFVMPMSTFVKQTNAGAAYNCIYNYEIAHIRETEGYKGVWYDQDNAPDNTYTSYYITVPANNGALYFTTESYYQNLIPEECVTGTSSGG